MITPAPPMVERLTEQFECGGGWIAHWMDRLNEFEESYSWAAAPMSLMVMKQQVYRHLNMPLGESMKDTNKLMAESLKRDDFRASLEQQVKFFTDLGQIKGVPGLDKAIVTDLV